MDTTGTRPLFEQHPTVDEAAPFGAAAQAQPRLRIAIIAPPWFAVPPSGYGGIERVVAYLADGLANRGHEVTLFAPGTSRSRARIQATYDEPQPELLGDVATEAWHVLQAARQHHDFDIIHDHSRLGLLALHASEVPVVHTIHNAIRAQERRLYDDIGTNARLIALSEHQRSFLSPHTDVDVIANAVDLSRSPYSDRGGSDLLFVGRMSPEKGIVEAIEIARRADMRLTIVAKINEPNERQYFGEVVQPLLAGVAHDYLDQPPEEVKLRAYANARAVLFPVQWDEPFGLVMIESMAAGTPVIAFNRGSVPEVIVDGKTGFIVETIADAVAAIGKLDQIDRRDCRERVRTHFSTEMSVDKHERLFHKLVAASPLPGEWTRTAF